MFVALLCAILLLSSFALAANNDNSATGISDTEEQYNRYTIDFNYLSQKKPYAAASGISGTAMHRLTAAKDFVLSLNLDESNYYYIEESCLQQLDQMIEDGVLLTSYSVLVPKSTTDALEFYGSYNGREYYSQIYSEYTKTVSVTSDKKEDCLAMWDAWAEGNVELAITYALNYADDVVVPILFDAFAAVMDIDSPFEVHDEAYFKGSVTAELKTRGIYTYDTNRRFGNDEGKLVMMMSDESGTARNYVTFHPNDVSSSTENRQISSSSPQEYFTYQYNNTQGNMSACNIYYNRGEGPIRYSLLPIMCTIAWELV